MIGLIGGSALRKLDGLLVEQTLHQHTPYGEPSAALPSEHLLAGKWCFCQDMASSTRLRRT